MCAGKGISTSLKRIDLRTQKRWFGDKLIMGSSYGADTIRDATKDSKRFETGEKYWARVWR